MPAFASRLRNEALDWYAAFAAARLGNERVRPRSSYSLTPHPIVWMAASSRGSPDGREGSEPSSSSSLSESSMSGSFRALALPSSSPCC